MSKVITLGDAIKEFLKEYKYSHKLKASEAINAWPVVMGKNIQAYTLRVYMNGNKLIVHLKSSVLRNELYMHRSKIRDSINQHLGSDVVKEVILK
ncbi:MAG TPA: DUF721 domain-containing protein [Perlabentimonas sp.]|jgi:hypothetical protein|nr:DUF721 domain-containing protein [Bacteroidales bacterium]MDD4671703.1 DUF721 domain-containing protein [Bacteroidales bacterium]MDY0348378.1 DUF721 domain-containing protein [Tenuifilaceae bacterium]HZJ74063.1 DUF721 domain-containing protein [Perlabentimonas sp.]